jgi:threonine dehydrogenase-like Zn-dependent dehydrogenase
MCVAAAKHLCPDAEVACLARYDFQSDAAKRMGADRVILSGKDLYRRIADLTGATYAKGHFGNEILFGGFDVIYDTVGNDRSLQDALRFTRAKGDVVILGINFQPGRIDYTPIWNQELRVTGINCHASEETGENSFDLAAKLLAQSPAPFESLITHRFPMRRWRDAVKTFLDKKNSHAVKIVLDHEK